MSNFSFFPPKVSNIWYNHLLRIVQLRTKTPATQQGIGPLIPEQLEEEDSLGIVEWSSWHKSVTINVYATCMFISKIQNPDIHVLVNVLQLVVQL